MRISDCGLSSVVFRTSLGWAGVAASDRGVCRVVLPGKEKRSVERELVEAALPPSLSRKGRGGMKMLEDAVKLLRQYFSGRPVLFDLPVDLRYYTAFQRAVWKAASAIPFGETRSYGWVARRIRNPDSARAVGQAMGANPVPVLVP